MEKVQMEHQQSGAHLSSSSSHSAHPHMMTLASSNDFSQHYAAALQWQHHAPQDHSAEICWDEEEHHPHASPSANGMPSFQHQATWADTSSCPPFLQQQRSMEGVVLHSGSVASLVCENSESGVLNDGHGCSEKEKAFPLSVVSGHHAIPFACKLNVPVNECRDMSFATMSGCSDESEVIYKGLTEGDAKLAGVMEKEGMDSTGSPLQQDKCVSTIGTGQTSDGAEKLEQVHCVQKASSTASYVDPAMGLRLGKRTYFEDGVASNIISDAALRSPGSHTAAGNGGSSTYSTTTTNSSLNNNGSSNDGSSKKLKTSPTAAIPRCQAEGCKADLSGAKDYHRRHKVCEWHSKASKAKVANLEQRFCQQCSRFHVLSEFDEGKRSCRRRLAGHNERRRKSQPEPMSLLSQGSFAYLADTKHLLGASFLDHPCFLQHKRAQVASSLDTAALACQLGLLAAAGADHAQALNLLPSNVKEEPVTGNQFPALELHHFVQGSRGLMAGGNGGGGPLVVTGGGGHGLAFSNPLGTMALSIAPAPNMGLLPTDPQPSSEVAASGRALSLLSSSLGSPNNPCSMSLAVPSSSCMHQLLTENDQQATASLQALTLHSSSHHIPHSYNSLTNSPTGSTVVPATNCPSFDGGQPSALQNFDGHPSYLSIMSDSRFESLQNGTNERRFLDLMSVEPNHHRQHQQVEVQYMDLEGLSMFGRSNIM